MLDPHRVVEYLWNTVGIRIPQAYIREFWHHSRQFKQPWAVNHEASDEHCPLGLYGDSAKITTTFGSDKMVGIFLNLPLWRPKSIRDSRYLLFAVEESKLHGPHTLMAIMQRITWSVNCLFSGRRPTEDPAGVELRDAKQLDGWICQTRDKFALTEVRGDQLWQKQTFRYTASWTWTSSRVCHACDARAHGPDSQDRLYFHFDTWLPHEFDHVQFLARRMPARNLCSVVATYVGVIRFRYMVQCHACTTMVIYAD